MRCTCEGMVQLTALQPWQAPANLMVDIAVASDSTRRPRKAHHAICCGNDCALVDRQRAIADDRDGHRWAAGTATARKRCAQRVGRHLQCQEEVDRWVCDRAMLFFLACLWPGMLGRDSC